MTILILIVAFSFNYLIFYLSETSQEDSLRISWLKTCITYGILISILTEVLSLNKSLNYISVTLFWLLVTFINLIIIFCLFHYKLFSWRGRNRWKFNFQGLDRTSQVSLVAVLIVLTITLATALIAPPNNWDSMTYHLPRVMHWIQNQSVDQYPTNNLRQISFPPGAAYIVTQFQLLTEGDRFANCVQWLAFLGCIVGISLITKILVGRKYQWISALVCLSIPMAIMQSMTTQTDLLTSFWLVCYTYFIFSHERYSKIDLFWIIASFSLAILTKPTAFIFGIPLSLIAAYRFINFKLKYGKNYGYLAWVKSILTLIILGLSCLSLSLPIYWRNYKTFGNLLGGETSKANTEFSLLNFISASLKNLWLNFPLPKLIPENPLKLVSPHEDFVGMPIHLVFIFLAIFYFFYMAFGNLFLGKVNRNKNLIFRQYRPLILLLLAIFTSFILFSLLIKFSFWNNRLLLPIFILSTPVVIFYICKILNHQKQRIIITTLALMALVYSLTPLRHPLITLPIISEQQLKEQSSSILLTKRQDIYFSGARKELKIPYQEAVNAIVKHQCHSIALAFGKDDWEYPLWVALENKLQKPFQIKYINVQNKSQKLNPEFANSQVCAVISTMSSYDIQNLNNSKQWQKLIVSEELPEIYLAVYLSK